MIDDSINPRDASNLLGHSTTIVSGSSALESAGNPDAGSGDSQLSDRSVVYALGDVSPQHDVNMSSDASYLCPHSGWTQAPTAERYGQLPGTSRVLVEGKPKNKLEILL